MAQQDYLKQVLLSSVYDVAKQTDLSPMPRLSEALGANVWLKREDQQPVKSFKLRGAYNLINKLTHAQKSQGVVAASAGNHAQGVAYSAKAMGIKAIIVMPQTTPEIKVEAVRNFGGDEVQVRLFGTSFNEASDEAQRLAAEQSYTYIPPFDHPDVIAGQGTIGRELLEQQNQLDMVFIAVGGGGLAAGIGAYIKALRPDIRIVAVEAEDSACLKAAMQAGEPIDLETVGIFADGVAVKRIGEETFKLCRECIDEVITVSNDEICAAIKDIFDDTRVIAEPAGALSVAGMRKYGLSNDLSGNNLAGILCGANINFHTLRYVSERCELGEQKEAVLAVRIPEHKGAFKAFCELLEGRAITEFNYRFASAKEAHIFVGVKLSGGQPELDLLMQHLDAAGYQAFDLSDNEMAKLHVRYMVGGRPPSLLDEKLYSFQFPERPGALMQFLQTLGERWNISLFHYRNHGAADGLVLCGFEIPTGDELEFSQHLRQLGYQYQEQTDNPAYRFFLSDANGVG